MTTITLESAGEAIRKTIAGSTHNFRFDHIEHQDRLLDGVTHLGRRDFAIYTVALKKEINRLTGEIRSARTRRRQIINSRRRLIDKGNDRMAEWIELQKLEKSLASLRVEAHNAIQMRLAMKAWARIEYRKRQEWAADHQTAKIGRAPELQDTPEQRAFARLILERIQPAIDQMSLRDVSVSDQGLSIVWEWDEYARGCHLGTVRESSILTWADILADRTDIETLLERNRVKKAA